MKYPLTSEAMEAARALVTKWDAGMEQYMAITMEPASDFAILSSRRALEKFGYPLAGTLFELAKYGLISLAYTYNDSGKMTRVEIVLLQELRNAVANDFEVSEYFLTMNAVGTLVHGNLTVHPGGIVQGAASNSGDVRVSASQVANEIEQLLGDELIQSNTELRTSLDELRLSNDVDRQSKLGRLISQLGNCLEHVANTAEVVAAIYVLGQFAHQVLR